MPDRYVRQCDMIRKVVESYESISVMSDYDDTISPVLEPFSDFVMQRLGLNFPIRECGSIHELTKPWAEQVTQVGLNNLFGEFFFHTGIGLALYPCAAEALQALSKHGELYLGTARETSWETISHEHLDHHLPNVFPQQNRFFCNLHNPDHTKRLPKVDLIRKFKIPFLVDDSTSTAIECAPYCIVLLPDREWNRMSDLPFNVVRIHDGWPAIQQLLTRE
jgi:hypothetical protein